MAKAPLVGKAFERRAGVREDDRSFRAVGVGFVFAHQPRGLLADQKRAERRVPKCVERHARVGFGNPLAKNAGNPAIDVVHDKRRRPKVSNNILEQQLHGRRFACIAGVSAHAVRLLQTLQHRFVRIPGCDGDTHAVFREQPGATRADAGTAANDECNVLYGRSSVAFVGLSHVSCSHVSPDVSHLRRNELPLIRNDRFRERRADEGARRDVARRFRRR